MNEKFVMENTNDFECLLIKPNSIKDLSYLDISYPTQISKINTYESIIMNNDNFIEIIATKLEVNKFNIPNLSIKNEIIAEDMYYIYELLYVDLLENNEYHINENEIASLLNINGEKIYSNALLLKNYLPSSSDSMIFVNVNITDIEKILYNRVNTKIVIWDDDNKWDEIRIVGDLYNFAKNYFENYDYEKIEIGFLMHNINIWYIPNTFGEKNICGSFIKKAIEKCLWFTMKSDELRDNLSLEEVKKIIYLSNTLTTYQLPSEFSNEKIDKYGRKIIYNKYKLLYLIYNKYL